MIKTLAPFESFTNFGGLLLPLGMGKNELDLDDRRSWSFSVLKTRAWRSEILESRLRPSYTRHHFKYLEMNMWSLRLSHNSPPVRSHSKYVFLDMYTSSHHLPRSNPWVTFSEPSLRYDSYRPSPSLPFYSKPPFSSAVPDSAMQSKQAE